MYLSQKLPDGDVLGVETCTVIFALISATCSPDFTTTKGLPNDPDFGPSRPRSPPVRI